MTMGNQKETGMRKNEPEASDLPYQKKCQNTSTSSKQLDIQNNFRNMFVQSFFRLLRKVNLMYQ